MSIIPYLESSRERHLEESIKVTEAKFTFVAVDDQGKPRAVDG